MLSFAVTDAFNSCSWCGRMEGGEVKSYEEADSCFWCNDGLALEGEIIWGKVGYKREDQFSGGG